MNTSDPPPHTHTHKIEEDSSKYFLYNVTYVMEMFVWLIAMASVFPGALRRAVWLDLQGNIWFL